MFGRVLLLGFAAISYLWPRQTLEWCLSVILAGVAAYLITLTHGVAPLLHFELMFRLFYIAIMWLFGIRRSKAVPSTTASVGANDN
jgi:hypothetical protein